ncbi:polysaccharide deacetylase family protein [Thiohalomonas denitrificans]|uniref:DUF7033 domain-containing protein n=1 Tax=Thiohalomonas denitrificans TaxID=415747 RepID=A0A1G5QJ00_9GAMM|nr:polysaccharide deacetylase family protein [Thiohalomonas denitrificans]SCZ61520.1 hypothetical protein SAMN03097708_02149 [Thiohalomonas denitrificans]
MTVIVEAPGIRRAEREYIISTVLGDFLGLDWKLQVHGRADVRITLSDQPGKELSFPDCLLGIDPESWLTAASLPEQPLGAWDVNELRLEIPLTEPVVPIIYGDAASVALCKHNLIKLPVDIFGSAFFMITRYEELVTPDRDDHDRFPAWASLAYKEGFLERPIVDEYVEILWSAMNSLWPGLFRKTRSFEIKVSHDVDRPSRYLFGSVNRFMRSIVGDLIKRGDIRRMMYAPLVRWGTPENLHPADPFNTFEWIMDVSEDYGLQSAFYFICGRTDQTMDADYDVEHPAIRALIRRIHERGHEIGLHPSYNTYLDPAALEAEAKRLWAVCEDEGIQQQAWGGRMHYLRWRQPTTLAAWESAGMAYDSTMGYADHVGFRSGVCREYPAFDLIARNKLRLRIRPLIVMECTVLSPKYMATVSPEAAAQRIVRLKEICERFSGEFTMLWHNSELVTPRRKGVYRQCLRGISGTVEE